jgi:hypothetical protein
MLFAGMDKDFIDKFQLFRPVTRWHFSPFVVRTKNLVEDELSSVYKGEGLIMMITPFLLIVNREIHSC